LLLPAGCGGGDRAVPAASQPKASAGRVIIVTRIFPALAAARALFLESSQQLAISKLAGGVICFTKCARVALFPRPVAQEGSFDPFDNAQGESPCSG
jgi:hypothetical protein